MRKHGALSLLFLKRMICITSGLELTLTVETLYDGEFVTTVFGKSESVFGGQFQTEFFGSKF